MGCIHISEYNPNIHSIISVHNTENDCNESCGVCCINGLCVYNTQTECANNNGIWYSGVTCDDVICPSPSLSPSPSPSPLMSPSPSPSDLSGGVCCIPQCFTDFSPYSIFNPLFGTGYPACMDSDGYCYAPGPQWGVEGYPFFRASTFGSTIKHIQSVEIYYFFDLVLFDVPGILGSCEWPALTQAIDSGLLLQITDGAPMAPVVAMFFRSSLTVNPSPTSMTFNPGYPSSTNTCYLFQSEERAVIGLGESIERVKYIHKYYECIDNNIIDKTQEALGGISIPTLDVWQDMEASGVYNLEGNDITNYSYTMQNVSPYYGTPEWTGSELSDLFPIVEGAPFNCFGMADGFTTSKITFVCNDTITQSGCLEGGVLNPPGVQLGVWHSGQNCATFDCNT